LSTARMQNNSGTASERTISIFQKGFNFSQDGPGNRLVYHLQGCNLRCPWCSNPEGLQLEGGMQYSIEELLDEVERSRMMFFDGGGVTLTGGEVTLQINAVKELFRALKEKRINTCIETNGTNPELPELFPVLDHLIMDVKHYDPAKHEAVTGLSNEDVFQNVRAALEQNVPLALRIPLIGGFNTSPEDAEAFAALFTGLGVPGNATVELLRYHEYGKEKYRQLGMEYTMDERARVSPETLQIFSEVLRAAGIDLVRT